MHRRLRSGAASVLAALVMLLGATPGLPYAHQRTFLDGAYRTQSRMSSSVSFRVNAGSLFGACLNRTGSLFGAAVLYTTSFQATIDGYEQWDMVPWANCSATYDGSTGATAAASDGENAIFFAIGAPNSVATQFFGTTGSNAGRITEGDILFADIDLVAGAFGGVVCQETGHTLGLDHSVVSGLFSPTTDNASESFGLNAANDNVLAQDDIAGISTLYPVLRLRFSGFIPIFTFAHLDDFGTVRGRVSPYGSTLPLNGAAVLAVNLSTGGAVVGTLSGTFNVRTSGGSGSLGTDGTGDYQLPCLPPGSYAIVACPLLNYLPNTTRLQGNGFSQADLGQSFVSGAQVVTVSAGQVRSGVNLDGNSGDLDNNGLWTVNDVAIIRRYIFDPGSFNWLQRLILPNKMDLNNDGSVTLADSSMAFSLVAMGNSALVAASVLR
ncbi:MAG: hypothetical protein AAB434_06250 [Planctomycetota bacterium]